MQVSISEEATCTDVNSRVRLHQLRGSVGRSYSSVFLPPATRHSPNHCFVCVNALGCCLDAWRLRHASRSLETQGDSPTSLAPRQPWAAHCARRDATSPPWLSASPPRHSPIKFWTFLHIPLFEFGLIRIRPCLVCPATADSHTRRWFGTKACASRPG